MEFVVPLEKELPPEEQEQEPSTPHFEDWSTEEPPSENPESGSQMSLF
jgi:hypothetical protein